MMTMAFGHPGSTGAQSRSDCELSASGSRQAYDKNRDHSPKAYE
jgi:hypothetical protein